MTQLSPIAECVDCRHSYGVPSVMSLSLVCRLTKKDAELPCARFERTQRSDVSDYIALQDGHPTPEQGRGD